MSKCILTILDESIDLATALDAETATITVSVKQLKALYQLANNSYCILGNDPAQKGDSGFEKLAEAAGLINADVQAEKRAEIFKALQYIRIGKISSPYRNLGNRHHPVKTKL